MTDLPEQSDQGSGPEDADTGPEDTGTGPEDAGTGPTTPPPASPPPAAPPTPAPQQQWPTQQQSDADRRNWAVGAHLSAIVASFVGLAVLGPLLVYLIKKDEDQFIAEHAREALNFQITWLVGGFVATILAVIVTVVTIGFGLIVFVPAAIGFAIAWLVFMIRASMAASRGEYYRYPLTVRVVS